jgi:hypothetical protein
VTIFAQAEQNKRVFELTGGDRAALVCIETGEIMFKTIDHGFAEGDPIFLAVFGQPLSLLIGLLEEFLDRFVVFMWRQFHA